MEKVEIRQKRLSSSPLEMGSDKLFFFFLDYLVAEISDDLNGNANLQSVWLQSAFKSVQTTIHTYTHTQIYRDSYSMSSEAGVAVAPALSTTQDEEVFHFAKFDTLERKRPYLGPISFTSVEELRNVLVDHYSIPKLLKFLSSRGEDGKLLYRQITLQFPDYLVSDSAIVLQLLQNGLADLSKQWQEKLQEAVEESYEEKKAQESLENEIDMTHLSHCGTKSTDIEAIKPCTGSCGNNCKNPKSQSSLSSEVQNVWILADTSYSPCCIDEVAAEHVSADLVVHFGDACLNPIDKLPAAYVFGKPYLDSTLFVSKFKEKYDDKEEKIVLMSDTLYTHHLRSIYTTLKPIYKNLAYAEIDFDKCGSNATIIDKYPIGKLESSIKVASRVIFGFDEDEIKYLEEEDYDQFTQDYKLFHINTPQDPHLLVLSTKFNDITIYDPLSGDLSDGPFPSLMKRYRYMHVARNAGTIGILVNTLSLANTRTLLNKTVKWIRNAGKKHYMFVVGKPNVAKLANFESIEVWCVLGCGQSGIIIDQFGDYYRPIITPYELQMALNFEVTWTGKWITDFQDVMNQDGYRDEDDEINEAEEKTKAAKKLIAGGDDDDDDDEPQFNPVTGQFVSTARPLRQVRHLDIEAEDTGNTGNGNELVKKFSSQMTIKGTVSTAASYLQNREWTGLGSDFKEQEEEEGYDEDGALVEDGRSGIARDYDYDRDVNGI